MFKTFRMAKERVTGATEQDVADKKHLKDMEGVCEAVRRSLAHACRAFAESCIATAAFHDDLANLYPAGETMSAVIVHISANNSVYREGPAIADKLFATLDRPLLLLLARLKHLSNKADERQVVRAEMGHYREKVVQLANAGLTNDKAQSKAESNTEKLHRNQARFTELDAEVTAALAALDHEIAETCNAAIAQMVQLQTGHASALMACMGGALAAIPGSGKAGGPIAAVVMDTPEPVHADMSSFLAGGAAGASSAPASAPAAVITSAAALFPPDDEAPPPPAAALPPPPPPATDAAPVAFASSDPDAVSTLPPPPPPEAAAPSLNPFD